MSFFVIPQCRRNLVQWVTFIDHRFYFPGLDQLFDEHQIRLAFLMPAENRVGWVLTAISLLLLALLAAQGMRARKP